MTESQPQLPEAPSPDQASGGPTDPPVKPGLSSGRLRRQRPLLVFALLGFGFAGCYAWDQWQDIRRLWDPLYGDPIFEAFRRYPLDEATVPRELFSVGNPRKDAIPTLSDPAVIAASQATRMRPDDRVIGIEIDGIARAYPLKILDWHEAVNDRLGTVPLAVTYCPLCDSAVVFDRRTPGREDELEFGVSGLLYNSNVVFYNRTRIEKESLWSQMGRAAVLGPRVNDELQVLPLELTTWADWLSRHPQSDVLSEETGTGQDYNAGSPYAEYLAGEFPLPMFTVEPFPSGQRLGHLERVLGLWKDGAAQAVPVSRFQASTSPTEFDVDLAGSTVTCVYDPASLSVRVVKADNEVRWMYAAWFAWYAFQPATELFEVATSHAP